MPFAIILGLSGLAVAAQSGLFSGNLEDEAREYAIVVWAIACLLTTIGIVIIVFNIIKRRRSK
ncbi:MAG: hypothetical protein JSV74_01570 [Dehalococcoidia bacterium]|nr:MAG: hypothetical protein JSV74_01570 [Dehalococcoidia bacterium]